TKIISLPESALGKSTIRDNFSPDFFRTNYWFWTSICCSIY
ncbi:oleate hydratase, partial [Candidatus Woesearchaeota archaeon]|nr:oleate hydratase [Candidatus Woesearchaeota archaeon]